MPDRAEDLRIAAAFLEPNPDAEVEFDQKYRNRLRYLATRAGVPAEDAEDVAQEALAAAISQMRREIFRGDSSLATWLTAILRGRVADYWRRMGRNPGCGIPRTSGSCDDPERTLATLSADTSDLDVVLSVRQMLERLPSLHRTVLILNQFDRYTTVEIATRLGRRPGTVGRILAEAKDMFRRSARTVFEESGRQVRLKQGETL